MKLLTARGRQIFWLALVTSVAGYSSLGCATSQVPHRPMGKSANVYVDDRRVAVNAMLDKFGSTLRAGSDYRKFLDTHATVTARNFFAILAENARAIPLGTLTFAVQGGEANDEPLPSGLQRILDEAGSSDYWVAPLIVSYGIGSSKLPTKIPMRLVVARYGDLWKIVDNPQQSALATQELPATSPPVIRRSLETLGVKQIWDLPKARGVTSTTLKGVIHVIGFSNENLEPLANEVVAATNAVAEKLGSLYSRLSGSVVVAATTSGEQFAALVADSRQDVAGASLYGRDQGLVSNQRIILNPNTVKLNSALRTVVLKHEIAHCATRPYSVDGARLWVVEGFAHYVGTSGSYSSLRASSPSLAAAVDSGQLVKDGQLAVTLPADEVFSVGNATLAYETSGSFFSFLAATTAPAQFSQFFRTMVSTTDPEVFSRSVPSILGFSSNELLSKWNNWLVKELRQK